MRTPISHNPKRGMIALTFALTMVLVVFTGLSAYLLALAACGIRVENAHNAAQALYAAESGIDIGLQTGRTGTWTGAVGRGRYAVHVGSEAITAVGEVPRAAGAPLRSAVTVATRGGRLVAGSWRQVPPARETELVAMLDKTREAPEMATGAREERR
jgi:hypothetical protein